MLTIKDGEFKMNGESFRIYSGSMHYFRIMPEYWEDRLRKLKAAGFNTVETYVCWNMHEPRKGEFDFTGRFDIRRFIKTAQEVGLYAIVRPGPYICAEWDFGGTARMAAQGQKHASALRLSRIFAACFGLLSQAV